MDSLILFRYLHFISILGVVASVVGQHLLLSDQLPRKTIRRISNLDAIYGISAILVVAAGLTMWFWVGKEPSFYSKNWILHLKVTLFIIAGLLSIIPTRFFSRNKKGDPEEVVNIPKKIKIILRIELTIFFILPLLASLMAYGVGSSK